MQKIKFVVEGKIYEVDLNIYFIQVWKVEEKLFFLYEFFFLDGKWIVYIEDYNLFICFIEMGVIY